MEILTCRKCNKEIQGFSKKHAEHLMMMHEITHRKEERSLELKNSLKSQSTGGMK